MKFEIINLKDKVAVFNLTFDFFGKEKQMRKEIYVANHQNKIKYSSIIGSYLPYILTLLHAINYTIDRAIKSQLILNCN